MSVNRREEVAGRVEAVFHVLAVLVGGADDAAGLDAAAGPQLGERVGPVVAAGLHGSGGLAGNAAPGAGFGGDLRSPAKFTRDADEHTLVEPARVDVLDKRGHGL